MVIPMHAGVWMAILILAGNLSFRHLRRYEWHIIYHFVISRVYNIKQAYPCIMTWIIMKISNCDVDLKMVIWVFHIQMYLGQFLQIIFLPILHSLESWWTCYICMNKKLFVNNQHFNGLDELELQNLRTSFYQ